MSITKPIMALGLVALCACAGTTATETATTSVPISTEMAFRDAVVGKQISFNGNTLIINADNTVSGPWDGSGISGTWYWEDQFWCREVTIGDVDRGLDCQTWSTDGTTATVTRDRGNGSSFDYTIGS